MFRATCVALRCLEESVYNRTTVELFREARMFRRSDDVLTPHQAAERLERGDIEVIDVREPDEWRAGHAPGSRHLPLGELPGGLEGIGGERPVAFVCRSGGRSGRAAKLARARGVEAFNVKGGLMAWDRAGLPLTGSA
jgi:rhodanese-related sulfurtransferase